MSILFLTTHIVYPQFDGYKKSVLGRIIRAKTESGDKVIVLSINSDSFPDDLANVFFNSHGIVFYSHIPSSSLSKARFLLYCLKHLLSLYSNQPKLVQNWSDPKFKSLVKGICLEHKVTKIIVESIFMYEAARGLEIKNEVVVHNYEYEFCRDVARLQRNVIKKFAYHIEAIRVKQYEISVLSEADSLLFLSSHDQVNISKQVALANKRTAIDPNLLYFESTITRGQVDNFILFNGSLKFEPNYHGMSWFCDKIYHKFQEHFPDIDIVITGGNSHCIVDEFSKYKNIKFTGFLTESALMDYFQRCICIISPILKGSGIKIKNVEALQLGIPLVMTEFSSRGVSNHKPSAALDNSPEAFYQLLADTIKNVSTETGNI